MPRVPRVGRFPCREIRFRGRENGGTKPTTETDENGSGQRAGEKSDAIVSQLSRDFTTLASFSVQ